MYYDPVLPWEEPLPHRVAQSTERISSIPTIASIAARYQFDAQVCHLRFLQYDDGRVIPCRYDQNREADMAIKRMKTPLRRIRPGSTSTRSTSTRNSSAKSQTTSDRPKTASTTFRIGTDFTKRNDRLHLGYRSVDDPTEMSEIMKRVSRPTSASIGGSNLAGKKYDYYTPQRTKTYRPLPELETRFMGRKDLNQEEYDKLLDRLTKHTKSSHWKVKSVPDPNSHPPRRLPGDYGRY